MKAIRYCSTFDRPASYLLINNARGDACRPEQPGEDGSFLDFLIIPNGARQATDAYGIDKTLNSDQTSHMRILGVVDDSVIVLGFEDLVNGGDRDYNDVIIAVEVGPDNMESIAAGLGL